MSEREAELRELLAKVEKAAGPLEALDGDIWRGTVGFDPEMLPAHWPDIGEAPPFFPPITASVDAALALVERILPKIHPHMTVRLETVFSGDRQSHKARITWPSHEVYTYSSEPALAICAALLKSLIDQPETIEYALSTDTRVSATPT